MESSSESAALTDPLTEHDREGGKGGTLKARLLNQLFSSPPTLATPRLSNPLPLERGSSEFPPSRP